MNKMLVTHLKTLLGNRFSTNKQDIRSHSKDKSSHLKAKPDAVCFPISSKEVIAIVSYCNQYKTPIVPFGAGTSLEAQVIPYSGGISVDLKMMNKVIKISKKDLTCDVQAGVRKHQLNKVLKKSGLFFPAGPQVDCTIAGMVSTCASGINAVKYGTMRNNVQSLSFISPTGKRIRTAQKARKSSAGYDLTNLLIGAEGTLGIITDLCLKLYPLPGHVLNTFISFRKLTHAIDSVIEILQHNIAPAAIELLDELQIKAVNAYSNLQLKELPSLFIELHGNKSSNKEMIKKIEKIVSKYRYVDFNTAISSRSRKKLWQARADCYYAARNLSPKAEAYTTDVCVPISKLADCIQRTKADVAKTKILAPLLGHVGDGNFHLIMLINPKDKKSIRDASWINKRLINRAISMGGTCTGEHGIGVGKMKYLLKEKGSSTVSAMADIKKAWDPNNIMNPGKIFKLADNNQ